MNRYKLLFLILLGTLPLKAVTFPDWAKSNNQLADSVNRTLTLIFPISSAHYAIPLDSIVAVYAWGSVSDYHNAVQACRMTEFSEDSCFYKTFSYDEMARPGDSGQPEFEFYTILSGDSTVYYTPDMMRDTSYDHRLMFFNGITPMLILLPGGPEYMTTDLDELQQRGVEAKQRRPLSDYNLTDSVDQHQISNFRLVPGTTNLYRSYHPYYPSVIDEETELERLYWVEQLAMRAGIQSAISLTGDMASYVGQSFECGGNVYTISMPLYYQTLMDNNNFCSISASATQCYYYPDGILFANYMRQIVEFIADEQHPMPVQVHCAIGADRTGVVCAVLAILCGADWSEVLNDYYLTSNMRCQTYRHPNRIRYAIHQLTGLDPDHSSVSQLSNAIRYHFVEEMNVLTYAQIDNMVRRLTGGATTDSKTINTSSNVQSWYDILGRPVRTNYPGVMIRIGSQGTCTKLIVCP